MRTKRPTLFFSFPSTAAAMEAERVCTLEKQPGRLVPIARQITAGCGLAWMADPGDEALLRAFFETNGLAWEGCTVLDFYR